MLVVSNNPLMKGGENVEFVEGSFRDVLVNVRDKVFLGYDLVSHPLFASSRMMFSPFRTVILGKRHHSSDLEQCQVAENAIILFERATEHRNEQPEHDMDYAAMDLRLHESALQEISILVDAHAI
jgi:hypothetical protein